MANYAYIRVSTDKQDAENQKYGVMQYANNHGITNVKYIEDTASGRLKWRDRSLGRLIDGMKEGDILLCAEISRLARSTIGVLEILETTAEKKVQVHVVKQNLIFKEQGDMTSTVMATMLGMVAQIEREFISQRTKEALRKKKEEGVQLGRPKGRAKSVKLDDRRSEIYAMVNAGVSKRSIARMLDCAPSTLYDWFKREKARNKKKRGKKNPLTPDELEAAGQRNWLAESADA